MFYLGKATFPFSRENQRFCIFTHKQVFASGVRCTCTNPTCGAHWRDTERTTAKNPRCAQRLKLFFFCQSRGAFSDGLLLCLLVFGGECQDSAVRPFLASSPLSIVKVDVSKISNRLPDYPTLKNNSHEAWKCSVQERSTLSGHTQRCSDAAARNNTQYHDRTIVLAPTSSSSSLISTRTPY